MLLLPGESGQTKAETEEGREKGAGGLMPFSKVRIDLAKHGKDTKILIDGEEPTAPFDVHVHANVGRPTKMTLYRPNTVAVTSYVAGTVEGNAIVRRVEICPKCKEEQIGSVVVNKFFGRWRRRTKGALQAIRQFKGRYIRPAEATEMGDKNRKYVA